MFKIKDHVVITDCGVPVTGTIVGTYTTLKFRDLVTGYVVELDAKYQGSIMTTAGDSYAFISQVVCHADNISLVDKPYHEDDGA